MTPEFVLGNDHIDHIVKILSSFFIADNLTEECMTVRKEASTMIVNFYFSVGMACWEIGSEMN